MPSIGEHIHEPIMRTFLANKFGEVSAIERLARECGLNNNQLFWRKLI